MRRSRRSSRTRFGTNEILTSLMLVYVAQLFLDWLVRGPWRDPQGHNFPQTVQFDGWPMLPEIFGDSGRANLGLRLRARRGGRGLVHDAPHAEGLRDHACSARRRGQGASPASRLDRMVCFAFLLSGAPGRPCRHLAKCRGAIGQLQPVISPGYGFTAIIVAFLGRLNPLGIVVAGPGAGADLSRRRGGADRARRLRQGGAGVPGHAAVLRARLRHADPLPHPARRLAAPAQARRSGGKPHGWACRHILLTIITASTPLLIAAIGELVVERSGVLNLGVEGMMVMGAVARLRRGYRRPARPGSACWRRSSSGALFSLLFGCPDAVAGRQPGGDRPGADAARPRSFRHDRRTTLSACPAIRLPQPRHSRPERHSRSSAGCCSARTRSSTSRSR